MRKSRQNTTDSKEYSAGFGFSIKDVFSMKPRVEISDNTSAVIDGSKGVLEYSKTQIRVSLGRLSLQIKGRNLNLKNISPASLLINGFITSVEYII